MDESHLSVLVALHSGSLSGIDTYAERIAAAGARARHDVTLVAIGGGVAVDVAKRLGGSHINVIATDDLARTGLRPAVRGVPTFAVGEMQGELEQTLRRRGEWFDVAHLNHPALAAAARPFARRIVVGAWFYPHSPRRRMLEVWRHTGGVFPTSAGFALKGLSHYWNDRRGYAASDCIVAPTELLAMQLRSLGLKAVVCPPPSHRPKSASRAGKGNGHGPGRKRRITVVCGDLDHPRKNVRTGIQAVHRLAAAGVDVSLELIGRNVEALSAVLAALPASVAVDAPGLLPRDQIQGRLMDSDVLLLPSLYEEWGYVATEALIVGTPVVAFPVYPFIEILSPPLGACASDMSPGALAQSLAQVLEDDASRPLVASLAAQRFGEDAVGRMLSGIWSGDAAPERETLAAAGRR